MLQTHKIIGEKIQTINFHFYEVNFHFKRFLKHEQRSI